MMTPEEISYGAVVFTRDAERIRYLLLKYGKGHWGFPKGHPDPSETERQTVLREVKEETGLSDLVFVGESINRTRYLLKRDGKTVSKEVFYYLVESKSTKVSLSFEHSAYEWLNFEDALERLTYKNTKKILRRADEIVKNAIGRK